MPDHRAHLDARITFVNGGSMTVERFRLDLPSAEATETDVARLLIQHLGLTLVGDVEFERLEIVEEQHRGSRGVAAAPPTTDASGRRLIDLSHTIHDGFVTYPGLPAPEIIPFLTRDASKEHYAPGTTFALDIITMIGNTGTYLDSPFHRYANGADLAGLSLEALADLPAEVFHLTHAVDRGIPASVFYEREVRGRAVLLHTGWSRHFGTPTYGTAAPFLTEGAAEYLSKQAVALVGIDSVNIDDTGPDAAGRRPAHSALLAAGIPIVEHLTNLAELPPTGARFTAVPAKVAAFGTFPVRAFASVPVFD
jgi:arylformamidase